MRTCAAEKWPHEPARVHVYKVKVLHSAKWIVKLTMADVPENAPEGESCVVYDSPLECIPYLIFSHNFNTRLSRDAE